MDDQKQKKGKLSLFKRLFGGFNESDNDNHSISYEVGGIRGVSPNMGMPEDEIENHKLAGGTNADWLQEFELPQDRLLQYEIFQKMAKTELVTACLQMHIAHALSPDMKTGNIITIETDDPEYKKLAEELMTDLGAMINDNVSNWALIMATYGVHYLRPYGKEGIGITNVESSYYTLAKNIKEYVRGDMIAGFTSEQLQIKETDEGSGKEYVRLAEPWVLVPLKIPFWSPDLNIEPTNNGSERYSLYTDLHLRYPTETQDYGTSLLAAAYPAWCELSESTNALRGARYNTSRQDRFISVGMEGLDPVSAANYLNSVTLQMRKDMEAEARIAANKGMKPTVWNRVLPVMAGGKGGITIDNQSVSADINGIEDTLFNLKRFCSAMGINPEMIGWSDMQNGGLGEGGWARTSIIAALKANWIRMAVRNMIHRLIEIHLAFKIGKAFPRNSSPFKITFHSINTALAIEKADELQAKVDFNTAVATLLDMIQMGRLNGSKSYKLLTMTQIGLTEEQAETILAELEANKPEEGEDGMFESINQDMDSRITNIVTEHLNKILLSAD